MTKKQAPPIAAEFVSFYRWSLYHDLALHSEITVLGWRCGLDAVSTEDEEMIINTMEKL